MIKPDLLRAVLLQLPDLKTEPGKLSILVENGAIRANTAPGSGFEYAYQLTAIIQDYAGDFDQLAYSVVAWLQSQQPDMLANDESRKRGFRFEVERISDELVDVQLELDLTEAVVPNADGTFTHVAEPIADPDSWLNVFV